MKQTPQTLLKNRKLSRSSYQIAYEQIKKKKSQENKPNPLLNPKG
jgi:hypothetical protein